MKDQEFSEMLVQLSEAIGKKGEKYVDLLRVLYRDLANVKADLEKAKCAFDLFQLLIACGILKPTDISVLFQTIELTGLKYLIEIIKRYETYPDEVEITHFTPHRQQIVALGKEFTLKDLQKVSQVYEGNFSSPWKLIQHLEDASVLTEKNISSFLQRLNENKVNEDFNQLLVTISDAIDMKGEKYVDMLRVLYKDLAEIKTELDEAKSAFDLFQILRVADVLKATDISILFETIEVTGLRYLKDIIKSYDTYPDEVKITRFSAHRQQVFALGKDFSTIDIQKICRKYEVPESFCSNPWKLITFLESKGIISKDNLSSFLKDLKTVDIGEASLSKRLKLDKGKPGKSKQLRKKRRLDKGIGETSISKRPKSDEDKSGESEQRKRSKADEDKSGQSEQPRRLRSDEDKLRHSEQPQRSRADEDLIIKDYLMTRQKELYQNEKRMTPAIWHKSHKVDIAEVFTELKLLQSKKEDKEKQKSTSTKKEGTPISLPKALEDIKSTDSCKVLITGKGGMGKTTLLKYVAHQWATNGEHVFAEKLLFLINIREIKTEAKFLDIILKKIDTEEIILKNNLSCDSVKRFLVTHDDEIVILLDGYDELKRNAKDPIDLFKRCELRKSMVVLTSRPDKTANLVECCDIHIEVKGFSPSNIKKYIEKHFHSINKIEIGDSLLKVFRFDSKNTREWGYYHEEAFELCSSPLLLLQICTIWELKRVLPTYLPDLFKEIICCILNQYLNRAGDKSVIANFDRIPDQYITAFLILGQCMYEGLKNNLLSIDKYDLSKNTNNEVLLNLALEFGFVYEDTPVNPGDVEEMYTPPHKLISEALAGLYLCTEIQKGSSKVDYEEIRCNEYLNMTKVFAIGFLGADADKLLKPWLIIRASNYRSIAKCLELVKIEHEDDILQKLDKHMPNDMKAYSEQMWESFRSLCSEYVKKIHDDIADRKQMLKSCKSFLNDDLPCINLFKFLKMYRNGFIIHYHLQTAVVSLINRCSERQCQIFVHTIMLLVFKEEDDIDYIAPTNLLQCISTWDNEEVNLLEAEMEKLHLKYHFTDFEIDFKISSTLLIHFLKYATKLEVLKFNNHRLVTGTILNEVINEMDNANRKLELQMLDIQGNDLNDIDGMLLGKLFKIAPELKFLNLANCRLSGGILRAMITECQNKIKKIDINNCSSSSDSINEKKEECGRMNTFLKDLKLRLANNDLSDIDSKSLAEVVRMNFQQCHYEPHCDWYDFYDCSDDYYDSIFRWSDYSLTVDNLEKLVESAGKNITLNWKWLDLSGINLSSMSGITLAHLFKVSPELNGISMCNCILSGRILNEMMEECYRMKVVFEDKRIFLKGNDLSDIDGKSFAALIVHSDIFEMKGWRHYSLKANNLKMLVEYVGENITLNWQFIDLSGINLSSMSGITLAQLFKVSPELKHINMSDCSLSGSIVNEMMEECCRMNVVLKDNILSLKGNDLSGIDDKSLAELVRVIQEGYNYGNQTFMWSNYSLTADNLKKLVESLGEENITLNWQRINLSKINLSSISGRTLACLVKISPDLIHIDMSYCSLSGRIVIEMVKECCRMNVVLKDNMFNLWCSHLRY